MYVLIVPVLFVRHIATSASLTFQSVACHHGRPRFVVGPAGMCDYRPVEPDMEPPAGCTADNATVENICEKLGITQKSTFVASVRADGLRPMIYTGKHRLIIAMPGTTTCTDTTRRTARFPEQRCL